MLKLGKIPFLILFMLPALAVAQLPYDRDYPVMNYADADTHDAVSLLFEDIETGRVELEHRGPRGYLESLLTLLNIDDSSQLLVFSKTVRRSRFVTPETSRPLSVNEEIYVGYIPASN